MFCKRCGKELPDTAAFCSGCGTPVGKTVVQEPIGVSGGGASTQQQVSQASQIYQISSQDNPAASASAPSNIASSPIGDTMLFGAPPSDFTAQSNAVSQSGYASQANSAVQSGYAPQASSANQSSYVPPTNYASSTNYVPPASSVTPATSPAASTATSNYNKLGGWLLAIVILWIIGGIYDIYIGISSWVGMSGYLSMMSSYGLGGIGMVLRLVFIISIAAGICGLLLSYFIVQRNNVFLRFYQQYAIGFAVIYLILMIAIAIFASGVGVDVMSYSGSMIGGTIGLILGAVLYTMYFCKSVRVRTYMGGIEYQQRALFRIGA